MCHLILERFWRVKGWVVVLSSEMKFGAEELEWSPSQTHGVVSFLEMKVLATIWGKGNQIIEEECIDWGEESEYGGEDARGGTEDESPLQSWLWVSGLRSKEDQEIFVSWKS